MKKFILPIVLLVVGFGLGFAIPHGTHNSEVLGGLYSPNTSHFVSGLYAGSSDQFSVDSSGNATTTGAISAAAFRLPSTSYAISSSSPAALGAASGGQFVVAASATTASVSSTAVSLTSVILVQNTGTTTIPGVTCNTAIASSTQVSTKIAGNGFIVKVSPAPTTNPYCFDFKLHN
jgi:hypothetical protein